MLHLCLPVLLRNLLFCLLQKHHQRTGHYCCGRSTATSSCISCTSCKTTVAVSFSYILYFLQWGVINCNPWKQSCSLFRLCTFTLLPQKNYRSHAKWVWNIFSPSYWELGIVQVPEKESFRVLLCLEVGASYFDCFAYVSIDQNENWIKYFAPEKQLLK